MQPPRLQPKADSLPPLIQAITEYDTWQRRRFHMPAHAGFSPVPEAWDLLRDPYRYDLTELEGLDVLSEPTDSIRESQERLAGLYGAAHSFMLVNGASVGLMAAMLSAVRPGEQVLVPRNAHRSVLSGLILSGAEPVWFLPERLGEWGLWGGVSPALVARLLQEHPRAKALFVTSPTYEGIGSDIAAISALCHQQGVLLVVDEAHGALWNFSEALPTSAVAQGADAVIHSIHKGGGALTQGALAHLPQGSRIDPGVFQQALNTLHTTSPSYLLMGSIEAACHMLVSPAGQERIQALLEAVTQLRGDWVGSLRYFRLFSGSPGQWDPCKLYFRLPAESGEYWGARFEEVYQVAYEAASIEGVLYYASLGLQSDDYEALRHAFISEEARLDQESPGGWVEEGLEKSSSRLEADVENLAPDMAMLPREAFFAPGERIAPQQAVGRVAKETVVHCPPGIPVIMPGERIRAEHVPLLPSDGVLVLA